MSSSGCAGAAFFAPPPLLIFLIGVDPLRAALELILMMLPDGSPFYPPRAISAGIVTALVVAAHLWFLSRAGRERQHEPDAG